MERINAMVDMPKYYGLCETCDHDATCMLRRSPKLEIIQCEEFSNRPAVPKATVAKTISVYSDPQEAAAMGLCSNCLNVLTCGFPNARQGILQCEEYALDEAGQVPPLQPNCSQSAA